MNKRVIIVVAALLMVSALFVETYAGGGKRNGTAGATELLIPVGAKGLALSGTYIAGITGVESIFYNPAGLGKAYGTAEAMFSQMTYIADINVSYAAVTTHLAGLGNIAFSIKSLDFGEIPVTTVENPEGTGAFFSPTYVTLGLTYANQLTDRINVGVTVKLVNETIMRTSATGIAVDAGVQYNDLVGVEGLKFGVVLKNLGPQMSFDGPDLLRKATETNSTRGTQYYSIDGAAFELPSQLELGLAYETKFEEDYSLMVASSFVNNNYDNDEYRFAGEFGFKDMIFLRAGIPLYSEADLAEEKVYGATFGFGLKLDVGVALSIDYAYRTVEYFDANSLLSVRVGF